MGLATFTFPLVVVFGLTRGKKLSSLFFLIPVLTFLGGVLKRFMQQLAYGRHLHQFLKLLFSGNILVYLLEEYLSKYL